MFEYTTSMTTHYSCHFENDSDIFEYIGYNIVYN